MVEKDKCVPKKKDRPTKRIFKFFSHYQHTTGNKQHCIKSYAPACIHNNVAKPYDKF